MHVWWHRYGGIDHVADSAEGFVPQVFMSICTATTYVGMVALIMLRILRKDLYRYNTLEQSDEAREEAREETGWKLVLFRSLSRSIYIYKPRMNGGSQRDWLEIGTLSLSSPLYIYILA